LVGTSGVTLLVAQEARDSLSDDERDALRLRSVENPTPEQKARLAAAENTHKIYEHHQAGRRKVV